MTLTLKARSLTEPKPRRRYVAKSRGVKPQPQGQLARQHAEAWYQALNRWEVRVATSRLPKMSYAQYRPGWEPESTLGEGGPDVATMLKTPINEAEVGRLITRMVESGVLEARATGQLLERIRGGSLTPRTLLREEDGRWQPDAPRHAAYAVAVLTLAVLTLAVHLRDQRAG